MLAFAYAYDKLVASQVRLGMDLIRPNISCDEGRGWSLGIELLTKFHQVEFQKQSFETKKAKRKLEFRFHSMELLVEFNSHRMVNELVSNLILFI